MELYDADLNQTLENRARLTQNQNLLYWYQRLYQRLFGDPGLLQTKRVLELGSGTSPLKHFFPTVYTSDILAADYLDYVFDCNEIDKFRKIRNASLDIVTVTNVLHHLKDPVAVLCKTATKLKKGGMFIAVEPYFSILSWPLYKCFHHEPVDFSIARPVLDEVRGPLSSSNQALGQMIFFTEGEWSDALRRFYRVVGIEYYTFIAYMLTGGISRRLPIPSALYRLLFRFDHWLASTFPSLFASFFVVRLERT